MACSSNLAVLQQWTAIEHHVASKLVLPLLILPSLPPPSVESGQAQRRREEKRQKLVERRDELRLLLHKEQLSYEVVQS